MKHLFLFVVILSNGKTVNEELIFISLEKCIEYERQINREASLITYNWFIAVFEVIDTNDQKE